jgi:hypothetical protein
VVGEGANGWVRGDAWLSVALGGWWAGSIIINKVDRILSGRIRPFITIIGSSFAIIHISTASSARLARLVISAPIVFICVPWLVFFFVL